MHPLYCLLEYVKELDLDSCGKQVLCVLTIPLNRQWEFLFLGILTPTVQCMTKTKCYLTQYLLLWFTAYKICYVFLSQPSFIGCFFFFSSKTCSMEFHFLLIFVFPLSIFWGKKHERENYLNFLVSLMKFSSTNRVVLCSDSVSISKFSRGVI